MRKIVAVLLALCLFTVCLTGCQQQPSNENSAASADAKAAQLLALDDYLASVKDQSNAIKTSLEQDSLTQNEMNQKSAELLDLWEAALNRLLDEAKQILPEEEMTTLTAEQNTWVKSKEEAVKAAGKEFEGGSIYSLVVNSEAANLIESRVYELNDRLK